MDNDNAELNAKGTSCHIFRRRFANRLFVLFCTALRCMVSLWIELFTLRESPPAHCKTATFARCSAYRELSVCALCLSTGGQRERRLRSRARRRRRRRKQESISRLLRSFALGASCKPLRAIVGPFWDILEASWALSGLSWGSFGARRS